MSTAPRVGGTEPPAQVAQGGEVDVADRHVGR
jgi:hypothetical protein